MNPPGSPPAQAATTEDIRDIRGPKPIASVWLLPLIGIAAVLIAAGGYGTWRWYRRRRDLRRRSPSDIALERLEKARALMQPAGGRAFSIEVSGIVREYIEARFRSDGGASDHRRIPARSADFYALLVSRAPGRARRISSILRSRQVRRLESDRRITWKRCCRAPGASSSSPPRRQNPSRDNRSLHLPTPPPLRETTYDSLPST